MSKQLPFPIETVGWNEMSESDRNFFCFEDEYLPLPAGHAAQIHRLKPGDARRVWQWLHDRGIPYGTDVFLVYQADQIIRMPWKLLVKYWDALAWSVGYAMIALDRSRQWACCFHHESVIVFGSYSMNRDVADG